MHALKCLAIYLNEYHTLAITFLNRKKLKTTLAHILFQNTSVDVIHPDVPALQTLRRINLQQSIGNEAYVNIFSALRQV